MSIQLVIASTSSDCPVCRSAIAFVWYIKPPDAPTVSFVACRACAHALSLEIESLARS